MPSNGDSRWQAIVSKGAHSIEHVCILREDWPVFAVGVTNGVMAFCA